MRTVELITALFSEVDEQMLVHVSIIRAKLAVIMRISSPSLPQRAAHFSDGTGLVYRSGPLPEPRRAVFALLKTRNQL